MNLMKNNENQQNVCFLYWQTSLLTSTTVTNQECKTGGISPRTILFRWDLRYNHHETNNKVSALFYFLLEASKRKTTIPICCRSVQTVPCHAEEILQGSKRGATYGYHIPMLTAEYKKATGTDDRS